MHRNASPQPPIIVLNLFYTGLGIARNLYPYGLRVIGLSAHGEAYGRFSRYCEVRSAPNSHEQPEALKKYLLGMSPELNGAVIFPTRDADVIFMDTYREELGKHFRLAIPSHDSLSKVMDKAALIETAIHAGTSVPRTLVVSEAGQIPQVATQVGYPCVVKPVRSVDWRRGANWQKVGGRKAFLVEDAGQFQKEYAAIASITPQLLVQEWIPGAAEQIVILGGYFGENAEPLAYFTARKLIQSPEDFGTGCIVESIALPELVSPTVSLCRALNYRGMAEVEYKLDRRTGEYKLIEINTRHWDWHRLGMASNVNVSWAAYCDATGRDYRPQTPQIQEAKWIAEDATLSFFLTGIYHRRFRVRDFMRKFSGRRQYGIFDWRDPLPALYSFFAIALPLTTRQIWNKLFRNDHGTQD
jgi:predicted ATP-grasp superfamily ATP-dependent carboligase